MSGFTTINGGQVASQFTAAASASQAVAFSQMIATGVPFTSIDSNTTTNATGGVLIGPGVTSATITSAQYVVSTQPNINLTVSSNAEVFAAPGDTVTASGADTLFGGDSGGGATSFISTGANSSIVGGTGNLAATASGANTTLIGGTGTNTFNVSGPNSIVVAGQADTVPGQSAGTTTITLSETTGGAEIATNPLGNSQNLVATLSAHGADTVVGGGGASTITGGGGNDVFAFVNGHAGGSEVINNFTASDTFAFGGYGYSASNVPTESYDVAGATGSDVITLTDGTTITLVGVDHKVF